jgi:hypothetical protein
MNDSILVKFGRVETIGGEDLRSTGIATAINPGSLLQESQDWFWTEEWQVRHEEAIADLEQGRFTVYETGRDLLSAMDEAIARNEARSRS